MNETLKMILRAATVALALSGGAPTASAAIVNVRTAGFADSTPDYYQVAFQSGVPGASIASVTFTLPSGFFDFDGDTNFANATAPVLNLPSLSGLSAADITFRFAGAQPTSLTADFAPGSFGIGDSFGFAADVDALGSKLGGVFGAGATFSASLASGSSGSAPFRTNTSVESLVTLTLADSADIPEPGSWVLLACGTIGLAACRMGRRGMTAHGARSGRE
jgi:hypothetical protein